MSNNIVIIQNFIYSQFDGYFNILMNFKGVLHLQCINNRVLNVQKYVYLTFHLCPSVLNAPMGEPKKKIVLLYRITVSFNK